MEKHNKSFIRRREIILTFDAMKQWDEELNSINHKKKGNRFVYPESFMETPDTPIRIWDCHSDKQRDIKSNLQSKAKTPTYYAIWKRVNNCDFKIYPKLGKDIIIVINSISIKVANRG